MNLNTYINFTPIFCINLCKIDFFSSYMFGKIHYKITCVWCFTYIITLLNYKLISLMAGHSTTHLNHFYFSLNH